MKTSLFAIVIASVSLAMLVGCNDGQASGNGGLGSAFGFGSSIGKSKSSARTISDEELLKIVDDCFNGANLAAVEKEHLGQRVRIQAEITSVGSYDNMYEVFLNPEVESNAFMGMPLNVLYCCRFPLTAQSTMANLQVGTTLTVEGTLNGVYKEQGQFSIFAYIDEPTIQ